jgi:NAD(P)-dependent dehydrogenase (short-subunit alcohol dehydrogenase family)
MLGSMTLVLVTGATDGIGRQTAHDLARRGARVLVHGRQEQKTAALVAELEAIAPGAAAPPIIADLSQLEEVRRMARALLTREERVDVLLHNAGVYMNEPVLSGDGFEMTFAVNHLAPFLLTHALLPMLRDGAPARVILVSSIAHTRGRIDVDRLGTAERFEPYSAYAASKLANALFAVELARRIGPGPLTVNALHPGVVSTKLLTEGFGMSGSDTLADSAATSVRLCLDADLEGVSGRYFVRGKEAALAPAALDQELARRLYEESCALVNVEGLRG